jgi:hypothetical protein
MFSAPLPLIDQFVEDLEACLRSHSGGRGLSRVQRAWLKFCLMGVLMTNTVCWKAFERSGLRGYGYSALSWMFRHSKIDWEGLWQASVTVVLAAHGITDGVLWSMTATYNGPSRQNGFIAPIVFTTRKLGARSMDSRWCLWCW